MYLVTSLGSRGSQRRRYAQGFFFVYQLSLLENINHARTVNFLRKKLQPGRRASPRRKEKGLPSCLAALPFTSISLTAVASRSSRNAPADPRITHTWHSEASRPALVSRSSFSFDATRHGVLMRLEPLPVSLHTSVYGCVVFPALNIFTTVVFLSTRTEWDK